MSGERPPDSSVETRQAVINIAIRSHQLLEESLGPEFYSVPALDMLFDLFLLGNRKPRSLTSLCGASQAPVRTALRTINRMADRGLLTRRPDPRDGRRTNVELTAQARSLLEGYFDALMSELIRQRP